MTPEHWRRIKQVFQSACECPPEGRGAYLDAVTEGDGELRREVEKMLRHATGAGPLDRPAWDGLLVDRPIDAGTWLGPYEILQEVGAGGMGRVYKARDSRLGRTVAIKVLSAEFSHRLRVEGRAISALNHPHVCALYDIDDREGYLVMEYVEGELLAGRLARGALPYDSVLRYGAEIADALAAAHAQGIVHRDLKPANIMITAAGVKVLDFGVARIVQDAESAGGGVVGTVAYMSPSQLNGNPADARSDIFSLGLVLFEMATGTRYSPHSPKDLAGLPSGLSSLMEQCLRQEAAGRIQSMEEVRAALERLRSDSVRPTGRRWTKQATAGAVAILAVAAALISKVPLKARHGRDTPPPKTSMVEESPVRAVAPQRSQPPPAEELAPVVVSPAISRPQVAPPSLVTVASYPGLERDPSFSPDGARIAFAWHNGSAAGYAIYVRGLNQSAPPLRLTDGTTQDWGPAWSPDGRKIAFQRRSGQPGIYWVSAAGGEPNLVASMARPHQETLPQISWSRDGKWIAAPDRDSKIATHIYLFAVANGEKRQLTFNGTGTDHAPAFSPDGKSLAYASCVQDVDPCDIYAIDLDRDLVPKRQRKITGEGVYIRGIAWLPDGRGLVYAAGARSSGATYLWRVSLSPQRPPQRIELAGSQARHPATSNSKGLLAYTRLRGWNLMMIKNFH